MTVAALAVSRAASYRYLLSRCKVLVELQLGSWEVGNPAFMLTDSELKRTELSCKSQATSGRPGGIASEPRGGAVCRRRGPGLLAFSLSLSLSLPSLPPSLPSSLCLSLSLSLVFRTVRQSTELLLSSVSKRNACRRMGFHDHCPCDAQTWGRKSTSQEHSSWYYPDATSAVD